MKKEGIPLEKFEILLHRVLYHRARGASLSIVSSGIRILKERIKLRLEISKGVWKRELVGTIVNKGGSGRAMEIINEAR